MIPTNKSRMYRYGTCNDLSLTITFTFTEVPCQVTWAITSFHRPRFSARRMSSVGLHVMLLLVMILSMSLCRCLPLDLFPSIFPVILSSSILFFLTACPINLSCLFFNCLISSLSVSACCSTSWFDLFAVQGILSILRMVHISNASNLSRASLFSVHVSQPYVKVDQT